jgi:CreA protein
MAAALPLRSLCDIPGPCPPAGGPYVGPGRRARRRRLDRSRRPFGAGDMKANIFWGLAGVLFALTAGAPALADSADPDLIFRKSTTFKLLTPNDKLAVYGIDDPLVEGVACHFTAPEKGGLSGAFGLAEQTSDISLSCRQYGPVKFKRKFEQGEVVFSERRSLFFKKMQIVRGCDVKRNILIYMTYSDKLIEGSPKNSTSTVPIEPWGTASGETAKCAEFVR